jgi:hypothetical protein
MRKMRPVKRTATTPTAAASSASRMIETKQPQGLRILEAAPVGACRIACHIDHDSGEPGEAGDSRHGRGHAKETARRRKASRQARDAARCARGRVEPEERRAEQDENRGEMNPAGDDEELESRHGSPVPLTSGEHALFKASP